MSMNGVDSTNVKDFKYLFECYIESDGSYHCDRYPIIYANQDGVYIEKVKEKNKNEKTLKMVGTFELYNFNELINRYTDQNGFNDIFNLIDGCITMVMTDANRFLKRPVDCSLVTMWSRDSVYFVTKDSDTVIDYINQFRHAQLTDFSEIDNQMTLLMNTLKALPMINETILYTIESAVLIYKLNHYRKEQS